MKKSEIIADLEKKHKKAMKNYKKAAKNYNVADNGSHAFAREINEIQKVLSYVRKITSLD